MNNDTLLIQRSTMPVDRVVAGNDKISIVNPRSITYLKAFGKCEQRNLPPEYTELEYIQSSNNAYIDTGIILPSDYERVVAKFSAEESNSNWRIFGCQSDSVCSLVPWPAGGSSNPLGYLAVGASWYLPKTQYDTISTSLNTPYEMDVIADNGNVSGTYCGEVFSKTYDDQLEQSLTITLFRNHGQNTITGSGGRLYYFKLWTSANTLAFNGIPAKNASNVIGMYDTVTSTFFTNQGTGSFIPGPNAIPTPDKPIDIICNNGVLKARHQSGLPIGYTLLDYIESTGTQYIMTGITPSDGSTVFVELGFIINQNSYTRRFLFSDGVNSVNHYCEVNASNKFGTGNAAGLTSPTLQANVVYNATTNITPSGLTNTIIVSDTKYTAYVDAYTSSQYGELRLFKIDGSFNCRYIGLTYVKISVNDTVVRNFVPSKDPDDVVGMYDTVSGQFFTNQGTGDFVAGNEVSDPVEIYTDGTVETINVHGKNLFDQALFNTDVSSTITYTTFEIPNGTYTMSTNFPVGNNVTNVFIFAGEVTSGAATLSNGVYDGQSRTITVTDGKYTVAYRSTTSSSSNTNNPKDYDFQLELGSTATAYEPYYNGGTATATNLLQTGDYKDTQDIISGNVTRRVGVLVLDGTEDWYRDNNDIYIYKTTLFGYSIPRNSVFLITHFTNTYGVNGFRIGNATFYMNNTGWNTVDDFKQYLAAQYTAGTPVIIVYPLASPIEEFAESQSITSKSGTNIVEVVESEIDNLDLEIRYRQK